MAEKNNDETIYPVRMEKELLQKSKTLAKKRGGSLAAMIRGYLIEETEAEEKRAQSGVL